MNPFASFQPSKRKVPASLQTSTRTSNAVEKQPFTLNNFLLQIDNDEIDLYLPRAEGKGHSRTLKGEATHEERFVTPTTSESLPVVNLKLFRQLVIEANFDIKALLCLQGCSHRNSYVRSKLTHFLESQKCFIYPLKARRADRYDITSYVNSHINKAKYWPLQESVCNSEFEHCLQEIQLRLLHWQEALHSALSAFFLDAAPHFYVLGDRGEGSNSAKSGPSTSCLFFSELSECPIQYSCLLIGASRTMLTRLHRLGVDMLDMDSSDTTKTSRHESISTAGMLRSSRLGRNVLIRGKLHVSIVAEALVEHVFGVLDHHHSPVNYNTRCDVPTILARVPFAYALPCYYEAAAINCKFNFDSIAAVSSTNDRLDYNNPACLPVHKVSLSGFICAAALPSLLELLVALADDFYKPTPSHPSAKKRVVSSSYSYLSVGKVEESVGQSKGLPMIIRSTTSAPTSGSTDLKNPMVVLTSDSIKFMQRQSMDRPDFDPYDHESGRKKDESSQGIRRDNWIRQQQSSGVPYFTAQLVCSSDHWTYFSYTDIRRQAVQSRSNNSDLSDETAYVAEGRDVIEEIRWKATAEKGFIQLHGIKLQPVQLRRTRIDDNHSVPALLMHDGISEGSILLEPLNEYSIFANS